MGEFAQRVKTAWSCLDLAVKTLVRTGCVVSHLNEHRKHKSVCTQTDQVTMWWVLFCKVSIFMVHLHNFSSTKFCVPHVGAVVYNKHCSLSLPVSCLQSS